MNKNEIKYNKKWNKVNDNKINYIKWEQNKVKNIVAFADGCVDNSAYMMHEAMLGSNHYVIRANNVYEIKNYRLSLDIANNLGCDYVLLLQDDDIYSDSIFSWIDNAIKLIVKILNRSISIGINSE